MRIAIDTNRYGDFARGEAQVQAIFEQAERIYVPFIVLGELRGGFLRGTKSEENERNLQSFLNRRGVSVLNSDDQTSHHYARLYAQLRNQGTPIPTNDIWIAALTFQHGLSLFARDAHFDHLPQLLRV